MHVSLLNQFLSKFEQEALEAMLPTLRADIELGEKFING